MSTRVMTVAAAALLAGAAAFAQDKGPPAGGRPAGDWQVVLDLPSTPASLRKLAREDFTRLSVAADGTCRLAGVSVVAYADRARREFALTGKLGPAGRDGRMELDVSSGKDEKSARRGSPSWTGACWSSPSVPGGWTAPRRSTT